MPLESCGTCVRRINELAARVVVTSPKRLALCPLCDRNDYLYPWVCLAGTRAIFNDIRIAHVTKTIDQLKVGKRP